MVLLVLCLSRVPRGIRRRAAARAPSTLTLLSTRLVPRACTAVRRGALFVAEWRGPRDAQRSAPKPATRKAPSLRLFRLVPHARFFSFIFPRARAWPSNRVRGGVLYALYGGGVAAGGRVAAACRGGQGAGEGMARHAEGCCGELRPCDSRRFFAASRPEDTVIRTKKSDEPGKDQGAWIRHCGKRQPPPV